jgi:hypothetical protein
MLKVNTPVGWASGVVGFVGTSFLVGIIRLFGAEFFKIDLQWVLAVLFATLGVWSIYSASKKLDSPISALYWQQLGGGIGTLTAVSVMSILYLLGVVRSPVFPNLW